MNAAESILLENIDDTDSLFVFPTDIAASRWADHLLRIKGGCIAMNKFTAWDNFKRDSIKSKVQKKKSIPSALRKIFIERLISENAENAANGKTPFFSSLIKPQWASCASQFSSWLTSILPQLSAWFLKTTNLGIGEILTEQAEMKAFMLEGDYKDMYSLAKRYAQFLEEHSLFEPAWETPPFNNEGKNVFIFFPESLSDYSEYEQLLKESSHVKIVISSGAEKKTTDSFFYTNSRGEIAEAALYIRALHEKQGIAWDSIAVCVCDPDSYEPYVLREFTNRNIPFIKRTSKPLSDYPAGRFFRCVLECASKDFSFASLVSLVMNKKLPWKKNQTIDELIEFGINNNCLFSWTEEKDGINKKINIWEDAFENPYGNFHSDIKYFFTNLKKMVTAFRSSASFAELRKQYFIFRENFFDMEKCPEETDLILSRCISELINLTELEKGFPDVSSTDPFIFFTEYLSEVYYLPQPKSSGVAILPYKTAAAAPFDCHIIINSSQESLSIVYRHLDFLPRKKREELGLNDEDVSSDFINMHKYNSVKVCAFFCGEQTFSGFAIPHSKINALTEPRGRYAQDEIYIDKFISDYYIEEQSFLSSSLSDTDASVFLYKNQINGFTEWKNRRINFSDSRNNNTWSGNKEINEIINASFAKTGKYSVSATSMQKYFYCSLNWLFERVFSLKNSKIETSLMAENISGQIYHAILNKFFIELKENNLIKPVSDGSALSLPDNYKKLLNDSINNIFNNFPYINKEETEMSSLTARLLTAAKTDYQNNLEIFLLQFLLYFSGCGVYGTENYYSFEYDSHKINGCVDIILKDNDNYIIVDFKTKNMPSLADCTAENENPITDFQLPMYITLTEEYKKIKVNTALFFSIIDPHPEVIIGSLTNDNTKKTIPSKEEDRITRESERYAILFNEFNNKKNQFVKEISSGDFNVFPHDNNDCFNCGFNRICRSVYIISRENIITGNI